MHLLWRVAVVRALAVSTIGADALPEARDGGIQMFLLKGRFARLLCSLAQGKQKVA